MPTELPASLSPKLLWLMAAACGVSVANVYYNQPLLGTLALYFPAPPWQVGLVATAAQVGYGAGIFFFLPLGDLMERRGLVVALVYVCAACLVAMAAAPTLPLLVAAQLLVGLSSISPQILIPLGAEMVPPEQRGKLIGTLMSGLLCGVLLARTVAGLVADHFGWRVLYATAAVLMLVLGVCLRASLPHRPAALRLPYVQLMRSMLELLRTQPILRRASLVSALSFAVFTAFWATLSFLLMERFHEGASEAGLFGIVGLIGAAGAPWAGRLSDRKGSGIHYRARPAAHCPGVRDHGPVGDDRGSRPGCFADGFGRAVHPGRRASQRHLAGAGSAVSPQHALHGGALRGRGGGLGARRPGLVVGRVAGCLSRLSGCLGGCVARSPPVAGSVTTTISLLGVRWAAPLFRGGRAFGQRVGHARRAGCLRRAAAHTPG